MPFNINKYGVELRCFAVWNGGFTSEEIDKIIDLEKLQTFEKGKVGTDRNEAAPVDIRDSDITWIHQDNHSFWLFERMAAIASRVNYDHFMYNIDGIDALQYTIYKPGGHYTWHWDKDFGFQNWERKISMVVVLSDPEDYEGGELEVVNTGDITQPVSFKPNKGDVVCFSSWMPHRVKPVISGTRKSLVSWVMGKREC